MVAENKVRLNLCISQNVKEAVRKTTKEHGVSASNLFSQTILKGKIYSFESLPVKEINKLFLQLNIIENHLYLLKKNIFETIENDNDLLVAFAELQGYLKEWHSIIIKQIDEVNNFIEKLNTVKKELHEL